MTRALPLRPSSVLLLAVLVAPLVACGAAAPMMAPPSGAKAAEAALAQPGVASASPATVDEALAALDRAESDVARALGPARSFAEAPASRARDEDKKDLGPRPHPAPASPPPPPASAGAESGPRDRVAADDRAGGSVALSQASPCVTACRALASMERAVEHLCGLAGPGDSRCESARARARTAAERVHSGCPACPAE